MDHSIYSIAPVVVILVGALFLGGSVAGLGLGSPECVSSTTVSMTYVVTCAPTACGEAYPDNACQARTTITYPSGNSYRYCACSDGAMWDPENGSPSGNCHAYVRINSSNEEDADCTSNENCTSPKVCTWLSEARTQCECQ